MRRPSQRQHVTKERRFSRPQRVLKDLAHGGHVEIVVHDDSGRIMYIYVPAPDRRSRAAVVRHVADALAAESPEESEGA